jgi:hypothetical protein
MKFWVATITSAILPKFGVLGWAPFALIAVVVVTAVFCPNQRVKQDAQEVLQILFGRRTG